MVSNSNTDSNSNSNNNSNSNSNTDSNTDSNINTDSNSNTRGKTKAKQAGVGAGPSGGNEYYWRQRLMAEVASSAGLTFDRVALEVLYYLPAEFLAAYEELFWTCFDAESGGGGGSGGGVGASVPDADGRSKGEKKGGDARAQLGRSILKKGDKAESGGASKPFGMLDSRGGRKYRQYWTIRDERAYRRKLRLDAKLKELAETMRAAAAMRTSLDEDSRLGKKAVSSNNAVSSNPPGKAGSRAGGKVGSKVGAVCSGCGRFLGAADRYCSGCGCKVK